MITIRPRRGTKEVLVKVPKHLMAHKRALEQSLGEIGQDVVNEAARLIKTGPKTGIHHPQLPNRSSAPGQAPATQSGDLARSGEYRVRNAYEMTVGENKINGEDYPRYLEDGTRRMAPRPHLIKAVRNTSQDGVMSILTNVDKELNG